MSAGCCQSLRPYSFPANAYSVSQVCEQTLNDRAGERYSSCVLPHIGLAIYRLKETTLRSYEVFETEPLGSLIHRRGVVRVYERSHHTANQFSIAIKSFHSSNV